MKQHNKVQCWVVKFKTAIDLATGDQFPNGGQKDQQVFPVSIHNPPLSGIPRLHLILMPLKKMFQDLLPLISF